MGIDEAGASKKPPLRIQLKSSFFFSIEGVEKEEEEEEKESEMKKGSFKKKKKHKKGKSVSFVSVQRYFFPSSQR